MESYERTQLDQKKTRTWRIGRAWDHIYSKTFTSKFKDSLKIKIIEHFNMLYSKQIKVTLIMNLAFKVWNSNHNSDTRWDFILLWTDHSTLSKTICRAHSSKEYCFFLLIKMPLISLLLLVSTLVSHLLHRVYRTNALLSSFLIKIALLITSSLVSEKQAFQIEWSLQSLKCQKCWSFFRTSIVQIFWMFL